MRGFLTMANSVVEQQRTVIAMQRVTSFPDSMNAQKDIAATKRGRIEMPCRRTPSWLTLR